jgi:hypothetical protein
MSDAPSALCDSVCSAAQSGAAGKADATDAAAQALYGQLFGALGGEADHAEQTSEACAGLVLANKKGAFFLWHLARGGAIGVTHAAVGRQLDPAELLGVCVRRMMIDADGQGADFGAVAQGVLEGALMAARELGLHEASLGLAVAVAALETAADIGPAASVKVRRIVNRPIMGREFDIPSSLLG